MSIRTTIAAGLTAALALTGATAATAGATDIAHTTPAFGDEITLDDIHADDEAAALAAELMAHLDNEADEAEDGVDRGALADSDGDGIPDVWEEEGVTLSDGTELPIHEWGVDPNKKDLFLQLNWMRSEYETLDCGERAADTTRCAQANTKTYRPTPEILDEIVDLFDEHGIALHIDAGATYTNIDNYPHLYGGETEDFAQFAFNGTNAATKLLANQKHLLGTRDAIFRVGVIGDQMNPRDYSSGIAIVGGNSFYIANNSRMRTDEQVRNTILHEFGHTLGLRHNGHKDHVEGLDNNRMHAEYHSVMNYNHQWNHFNYSTESYTRTDNGVTRTIPADWDVIELANRTIGKGAATIGAALNHDAVAKVNEDKARVEDAVAKAGTANMTVLTDTTTKQVKPGETVAIEVEVTNPGIDLAAYTVEASYPGGAATGKVTLEGAFSGRNTTTVTVEVKAANTATMPVTITINDARNTPLVEQTVTIAVDNGQANTQANTTAAQPVSYEGQTITKANTAPAKIVNAQMAKVDTAPAAGETNLAAIIAPIVIALLAAIGAGIAAIGM